MLARQCKRREAIMENNIPKWQRLFLTFIYFSVIGWLYEVFLEMVIYQWGFSNRGVLFGPYTIVYGFGALILFAALKAIQKRGVLQNQSIFCFSHHHHYSHQRRTCSQLSDGGHLWPVDLGLHPLHLKL